jgi:HlyD family secretion protein
VEDWGGAPLAATVARIDPIAFTKISALGIEQQRTRVVLKLLGESERRERLGHGFSVIARIVLWRGEDVLTVPMAALFRRGDAWAVFVVNEGRAVQKEIQLGQRNDVDAEVVAGLEQDDVVILHPADTIEDGVAISALPTSSEGSPM